MDKNTILHPEPCDVTRLQLTALEAFFLSQVDGKLKLFEVAELSFYDVDNAIRLARRLVEMGAVSASTRSSARPARHDPRAEKDSSLRPPRHDPRAEKDSSLRPPRHDPRAEKQSSLRPPRKSIHVKAVTVAPKPPKAIDEICELDDATVARITAFDRTLATHDHYALLGVDRGAERKAIKNAYFALASKFHPDRFFKKKLGHVRPILERVFSRITEAHDVLTDRARREAYDAKLPPAPRVRVSSKPPSSRASKAPPSSRSSKAPSVRVSKAPSAPPRASKSPPKAHTMPPKRASKQIKAIVALLRPKKMLAPAMRSHPPKPATSAAPRPMSGAPRSMSGAPGSMSRAEVQRRVEIFVQAADEALRANDVIAAANNYRLALENSDDPVIRAKLEQVDELAKQRRSELSLGRARAAERDQRWADAAFEYAKAHQARPSAELADRASHALRMSGGDLRRAVSLAEFAVTAEPRNTSYRITLAEAYLAAGLLERASAESTKALASAPDDERIKRLVLAVKKARG